VTDLNFAVFDGDHHLYETEDAFTRHLPAELGTMFRYVQVGGRTKIAVRGVLSDYIPNPTFEVVARPGAHMDYYANRNVEGKTMRELAGEPMRCIPAFRNPAARVELLDELGIDAALIFPTLASLVEVNFMDLPEQTLTILHAFNQWMLDEWTFSYQERLFPTPVVNPANPERAVEELDWLLDNGARVVLLRPAPVAGNPSSRSPFLPDFDPFWARVQEAGIPVALHGSDSGYQRHINDWEGDDSEMSPFKPRTFGVAVTDARRPIQDTIFSAICHGMLTRFPDVRLVSVENGGMWVLQVMSSLEHVYGKLPQEFSEHPLETFHRCVYVNPFWEDPAATLIDAIGADRLVFGSDYPHPEGLAEPLSYADRLSESTEEDRRKVMGGNLYDLLRVKLPA
jgi:predicted TIM-barrel fold metal-dependent hydrolase